MSPPPYSIDGGLALIKSSSLEEAKIIKISLRA